MTKDEMKNRISMALKDPILQQGFEIICKNLADLEKENTELKESNKMLEQGYVWHDYDAGEDCYEDSHAGKWVKRDEVYQLTKAKDLLKQWLQTSKASGCDNINIVTDTEQFLNEVEK